MVEAGSKGSRWTDAFQLKEGATSESGYVSSYKERLQDYPGAINNLSLIHI